MSGICGIVNFDEKVVREEEIQNMLDSMKNRGNDAEKILLDGNIGFGHKMLWTTPESLHENQPLISKDGNLILTADARIDNRDELFEKLQINENDFDVITDVDLILWSYQKWGNNCVKHLIGDFAFVFYETKNKKLFLVRDRLGLKPLYYIYDDNYLIFSSEISALHNIAPFKKQPNINAIHCYLNCNAIDYDQTFFENIFCLPPASQIIYSRQSLQKSRYWHLYDSDIHHDITFKEASEKFITLFEQSVKNCSRSAYPIGCELSGGLDSSSVFVMANSLEDQHEILPFSFRFGNMSCDEGGFIAPVLEKSKKEAVQIDFDEVNSEETMDLDQFYKNYPDWPNDMNAVMTIPLVREIQKRNIHVLLTGQGGDQVTGGNLFYLADYLRDFKLIKLIKELSYYSYPLYILRNYVLIPLLSSKVKSFLKRYVLKSKKSNSINFNECNTFVACDWDIERKKYHSISSWKDAEYTVGPLNAFWANVNFYQQLGYFGIEARHPFYDTRLIEFVFSLPSDFTFSRKITKRILRESIGNLLPKKINNRKDKAEFSEPLKILIDTLCINMDFNNLYVIKEGIIKEKTIDSIMNNLNNKNLYTLYAIINLEKWWSTNFAGVKENEKKEY